MEIVVRVCNVCKEVGKPVAEFSLASETRGGFVHLCADDAAPVEAILDTVQEDEPSPHPVAARAKPASKAPAKKVAPGKGRRSSRHATIEEIEASKSQ